MISIDTLRADHLGLYGYGRDTSPHLDRLARDGVVVERHVAHSPWTLPSHMSMFSGVIPSEHGATEPVSAVSPARTLFPEILKDRGYRNIAFTTNILIGASYGFSAGFDIFVVKAEWNAKTVSDNALRWYLGDKRPTFLFLHIFDPHYPYDPPKAFRGRFGPGHPGVDKIQKEGFYDYFEWMNKHGAPERRAAVDLYDEEIASTDAVLGRVFERLRAAGRYENSWIIVTSDHGEEFGERGLWGHGITLYDEMLRVPLIIKTPHGVCGGSRFASAPIPQKALFKLITGAALPPAQNAAAMTCTDEGVPRIVADLADAGPIIAESDLVGPRRYAAMEQGRKLIEPINVSAAGVLEFESGYELYNFENDPKERDNLLTTGEGSMAERIAAKAGALHQASCRTRLNYAATRPGERIALDEETKAKLKSLGYISSSGEPDAGVALDENCMPIDNPNL
ncbi:MAG: sulfatase [Deltaproteobacteria bacterium]|nr:sulfatase [Deltaproteobacteria bacterium]